VCAVAEDNPEVGESITLGQLATLPRRVAMIHELIAARPAWGPAAASGCPTARSTRCPSRRHCGGTRCTPMTSATSGCGNWPVRWAPGSVPRRLRTTGWARPARAHASFAHVRYLSQGRADAGRPHIASREATRILLTRPDNFAAAQHEAAARISSAAPR
jgi:hypothetical protein